jgi:hypothetical protein
VTDQSKWDANYSKANHDRLNALWAAFVSRDTEVDGFELNNELYDLCEQMGVQQHFDLR